jgi:drug/metabolite transporter (DMT)-like permease
METIANKRSVYLMLILTTLFWGANFNLGKYVLDTVEPMNAGAWRFMMAAAIMVVVVLVREKPDWQGIRQNLPALVAMALIGIFGFNLAFFFGLRTTSSINGSLIMTLNPSITVILASIVMNEAIRPRQVLGLALSMVGVVVVVTGGSWQSLTHLSFASGDLLILIGNLCWAIYSVIGKRAVKNLSSLQTTAVTMLIGAVAINAMALTMHNGSLPVPPSSSLLVLGVMAVFGTVLGYLFWNKGIGAIGPARTAVFFDLVPIFTMLIAIALGQQVILAQWFGAILVMTGVLFSSGALEGWSLPIIAQSRRIAATKSN